jgi:DNA-binding NarL/FixJ family response regulator
MLHRRCAQRTVAHDPIRIAPGDTSPDPSARGDATMSVRVLLVDDHALFRDGTAALLALESGFEVVGTAANGHDAIEATRATSPDVIVMDISMPVLNGIDATAQIVAERPSMRVLICSMHQDPVMVRRALEAGAIGYVTKMNRTPELVRAIRATASGDGYLSDGLGAEMARSYHAGCGNRSGAALLTPRERAVLQLIAEGASTSDIATRLAISPKTVGSHRERLMAKLGTRSIADVTRFAIREGVVELQG